MNGQTNLFPWADTYRGASVASPPPKTRRTSAIAFQQIQDEGLLGELQIKVYRCLYRHGPMSQNEVFLKLNMKPNQKNSVTARFSELKQMGVIQEVDEGPCSVTGRLVIKWDVTDKLPKKLPKKEKKPTKDEILADLILLKEDYALLEMWIRNKHIDKIIEKVEKL